MMISLLPVVKVLHFVAEVHVCVVKVLHVLAEAHVLGVQLVNLISNVLVPSGEVARVQRAASSDATQHQHTHPAGYHTCAAARRADDG